MLEKNVGSVDRAIRIIFGVALLAGFFMTSGAYSWLYLLGVVPLASGLMSSCMMYSVLGISTAKLENH